MSVAPSSVLYYPTIDITNEKWLRNASLFWDTIQTIVPESIDNPYKSKLARELNDIGLLQPINVSSSMEEIDELADMLEDYITDPACIDLLISEDVYNGAYIHPDKISHKLRDIWEIIHLDKLPYRLRSYIDDTESHWFHVHPEFAKFYMTALARRLAQSRGIGLVTDLAFADRLALAIGKGKPVRRLGLRHSRQSHDRNGSAPTAVTGALLVDLIVETISPPQHLSAQEIVKFKKDHYEELVVFRREIHKLVGQLPEDCSIEALRQHVHDIYNGDIKPALKSLKQSISMRSWDTALQGVLKISFFTAPQAAVAIYAGVPSSVALLAGAGISLTASSMQFFQRRRELLNNNPYSYLLSLESFLK